MRTPLGRRCRLALNKFETLESRDLLAQVLPIDPPAGMVSPPPVVVVAQTPIVAPGSPQVAYVQFEPLTGRVLVALTGDTAGYDPATLTNPANYSFRLVESFTKLPTTSTSRPKAGVVLAPTFQITGVTLSTPVAAGMPQSLLISINNNQPLREGVYQFTIRSAGIVDGVGRPLDGQYNGTFPSGGAGPAGDFVALLAQTHNTVLPALPTTPQPTSTGTVPTYVFYPSTSAVRVRYAAAKPGKFTLVGGNNLTLIPLGNQNFPGTFRLPSPKVNPAHQATSPKKKPA